MKDKVFNELNICILILQIVMLYALFVAGTNSYMYYMNSKEQQVMKYNSEEKNFLVLSADNKDMLLNMNYNDITDHKKVMPVSNEYKMMKKNHIDSLQYNSKRLKGIYLHNRSMDQMQYINQLNDSPMYMRLSYNYKIYQGSSLNLYDLYHLESEYVSQDKCIANIKVSLTVVFIALILNFLILKYEKRKKKLYMKDYKYIYNKLDILSMNIVMLFILIGTLNYHFLLIWLIPALLLLYLQYLLYKHILYKKHE